MVLNRNAGLFSKFGAIGGEAFGIVSITVLLLSLHLHGLWSFQIFGHIDISLSSVAIALTAVIWLLYAFAGRLSIGSFLGTGLFLAGLFAVWVGFESFRSPEPVRGLTMFFLAIQGVLTLWLMGGGAAFIRDASKLNRSVFFAGVGIAGISTVLFLWHARSYSVILANRYLWKPGIIYELDQGGILRLIGFSGDPNFYSLWMVVPLLCGIALKGAVSRVLRWVGIFIIGVSLLLAMSRGFALAFVGATLLLGFVWAIKNHWRSEVVRQYTKPLVVGGLFLLFFSFIRLPFFDKSIAQMVIERFRLAESSPRWELWETVWGVGLQNILFGHGLRSTEVVLGGMYSHNSYLDLIVETGIVGLSLWGFLIVFVSWRALRLLRVRSMLPWVHVWFITLVFLFGFSLTYSPFLWLLPSVILGYVPCEKGAKS